jgi:chemotaxis protein CheC
MYKFPENLDVQLKTQLNTMADAGIHNAAQGISKMVGELLTVSSPVVQLVPISDIPRLLGGPENEAVGIYLRAEGKISGQIMIVIPFEKTLSMVDLLMGLPIGTTTHLGSLERSALGELGNMAGTFFLNAIADLVGLEARPTPPAVMVDMIGAILNILFASWDGVSENVLMIQATFIRGEQELQADFWMIPDRCTLEEIARKKIKSND